MDRGTGQENQPPVWAWWISTWLRLHPEPGRCCFLSGSWPDGRSLSGGPDTSQTRAHTAPSAKHKPPSAHTQTQAQQGWAGQNRLWGFHTSLGRLLLENTLRGQDRWWCLEIQLRMLSHSAVPLGGGPSSRCNRTSCFWARTALLSSIRSN